MKITVVTQAYNAEKYIAQCIESVLNQTHNDLQYILIDNGSTDNSGNIMRKYAESDSRIKFIQFEQNGSGRWPKALNEFGEGDFFANLDADDWLEPDYLERLVDLVESTNSDIVTTGSFMHIEETSQVFKRESPQRIVLDKRDLANAFPFYHVFFRVVWGKLVNLKIFKSTRFISVQETNVAYGIDTLNAFAWLRNANRICIDNSILHHYRIHQKSVSHKYDPRQSYSDLYLYNDALDFLASYGPVSAQNQDFLYRVYANAIIDTVENIKKSTLSPEEKMSEYRKILTRKETLNAYGTHSKDTTNSKNALLCAALECAAELPEENADFNDIKSKYFPRCADAVKGKISRLFANEQPLFDALVSDEKETLAANLLSMIEKQKYAKQYDLGGSLCALAQDKPLLAEISDSRFIRKNSEIYRLVWTEKFGDALDMMTDKLLKEKIPFGDFFELYLSIAAMLECADEFIFGKIKQARFYFENNEKEKCAEILTDITEMGVEDDEEISDIKRRLNL